MTKLLIMDGDELKNHILFDKALQLVSNTRRKRIEQLHKEESKRLSLAAGLLLRYAFLSVNKEHLLDKIQISDMGKPFLPNHDYFFSLSHSGRFAICAFSDRPIGCDIEKIREKIPKYKHKIFSTAEELVFETLTEVAQIHFFFNLWTAKESITKMIGKGITYPFHSFSIMDHEQVKKITSFEEEKFYLKSYYFENYILTFCAKTFEFPEKMEFLTCKQLM